MAIQMDFMFGIFTGLFVLMLIFLIYISKKFPGHITWFAFTALLCLYVLGLITINWQGKLKEDEIREQLKIQVEAITHTINKEHIKSLDFTLSDKSKPEFAGICNQMRAYKNAIIPIFGTKDISIYTMILRDSTIIFGPESIQENERYASPPGTIYQQPNPLLKHIFTKGFTITNGPYTDEYGTFLSGFAPVFEPASGKVLLVVGMDINFSEVQAVISRHNIFVYLCTALLALVFILAGLLHSIASKLPKKFRVNIEGFNVAIFGLTFTLLIALVLHQNGNRSRNAVFSEVSDPKARSLSKAFMNLRDFQVTALVRYFNGPKVISREAFHELLSPMFRISGRQTSIGWIIPVTADEKEKTELQAREEGMNDFSIWQPDLDGNKIAVSGRSRYYPLWYFEPSDGNIPLPGFDFASDPVISKTIEKAINTGMPAATEPIVLPLDKSKTKRILVFQPVFTNDPIDSTFKGLVVAMVNPDAFLKRAISSDNSGTPQAIVDFYQLSTDSPPQLIACTHNENQSYHNENDYNFGGNNRKVQTVIYPIFVFDKTYAALIYPAPDSYSAIPVFAGWIAVAVGLLITFLFTFLTVLLSRRNENLGIQVEARTAELKESEEKYRGFFNSSIVGVAITSTEGKWLYFNNKLCEMLGYSREELSNMTWREITPIVDLEQERAAYNTVLAGATPQNIEKKYICKDGSLIDVSISTGMVHNPDGSIAYFSSVIQDITQRKRAEELLKKSESELRALNIQKDKFFSIIAHDLKSPFNAIMGYSEFLVEQVKANDFEDVDKYAEIILQSSQRALDLLMNLMEWSRAQTGRIEFNPGHFDLDDFMNGITPLFDNIAGQKIITITADLPPNIKVYADQPMLSTVMRNLISNAIKFTHPGGKIRISAEENQDMITVSISDTGVGISKTMINKLFRIDENYSTSGTQNEKGTGLGLILCKEFIEKHNGKIWVESEEGIGSTFTFALPGSPKA